MDFSEFEKAVEKEFNDCLKKFPELKNIGLVVKEAPGLSGAEGRLGKKRVVILFVPKVLFDKPRVLRPIIFHELSHMLDLENPDRVFMQRADEESKRLWQMLQKNKEIKCTVENRNKNGD